MTETNDLAMTASEQARREVQLDRSQYYVCHERHVFHRYNILRDSPAFPLLFMDRCYDWQFEVTGDVPIISRYNGFMELVCRDSWSERDVPVEQLGKEIRSAVAAGSHVALLVSLVHTDGTPYLTEWLVVDIDDEDTVYYTKTSPDPNFRADRKPVPFAKLTESLAYTEDGLVPVTEIRPSAVIDRLVGLAPLDAFRAVFAEFGLRLYDGRLSRYVTPVVVGVDGIDRLIADWERRADAILAEGAVLFNDQSRLNKHIQNRFQPVQHYLHYLLGEPTITAALGEELCGEVREQIGRMDAALADILKFSSLLVQMPRKQNFDLYLKYLRRLRDTVADYQQTNVRIQLTLLK
ncbi:MULTISPECIES: hypothetical protein [unclassified Kitasatospora]|uniref:hypothetical protein n=1 Tax=unclassified Kitasatospora TaxID=2633591 RepID=UPI001ADFBD12|nr:hypothetical protein [Kitasatospora sp. RG8]MBP0448387.1 hypothetical protein [Kitasatospora sp. RG8]